jgi:hypothetical protein
MSKRPKITEDFSFDDAVEAVDVDMVSMDPPAEAVEFGDPKARPDTKEDALAMEDDDFAAAIKITATAAPPAPAPTPTAPTAARPKPAKRPLQPEPEPTVVAPVASSVAAPVEDEDSPDELNKAVSALCVFQVDADSFAEYLEKILLSSLVEDAYVQVLPDGLFCAYTDRKNEGLTGFVRMVDGVQVTQAGAFIMPRVLKLRNIVNQFTGTVRVEYKDGFISVQSLTSRKRVQLLGYDTGFVNSLRGINLRQIDLRNCKLGTYNFKDDICVQINKTALDEIVKGAVAIELTNFKFTFAAGATSVKVLITNHQDEFELEIPTHDSTISKSLEVTFLLGGMKEVLKNVTDTLRLWVNDTFLLLNSGTDYFMFMAVEDSSGL